jgi:hypothetical protein
MPISKQRNKHIQQVLVDAAKLTPRYNHELALVYERERQRGNKDRATLAVARKMVGNLLAVERRKQDFVPTEQAPRRRKNLPGNTKHQDHSVGRLPGPAGHGLSDGGNSLGSHLGLFRDWQRTQTQSSVRTFQSLRQQMDVRFCGEQEPPAERHCCAAADSDETNSALS